MTLLSVGGRFSLAWLSADGQRLLLTRLLRTFAYGFLGVVLALYLEQLGLDGVQIGFVLTAAVAGSALMNVFWSIQADQFGRRRTVLSMALLMAFGGLVFALTGRHHQHRAHHCERISPVISGLAFGMAALGLPFVIAGGLKVVYDGP